MKILLVEDEAIVRLALKSLVNWQEHGIDIPLEAGNGIEALDILQKNRDIDVIITDINMPIMNGLELIRRVKEQQLNITFLVLSAYDDYDLVREAFKLGIDDYILKTEMDPDNIVKLLEKIRDNRGESIVKRAISQQDNRRLIKEWLDKKNDYPSSMIKLLYSQYVVFAVWIDEFNQLISHSENIHEKEIVTMVLNGIQQILDQEEQGEVVDLSPKEYIILFSINEVSQLKAREKCNLIIQRCRYLLSQYLDISISVGISSVKTGLDSIPSLYKQAKKHVNYRYIVGKGKNIYPESLADLSQSKQESIIGKEARLINALRSLEKEKIQAETRRILKWIGDFEAEGIEDLYAFYLELIFIINYYLSQEDLSEDSMFEHNTNFYMIIKNYETRSEIELWFHNWIGNIVDYLILNNNYINNSIIKQVMHYIDNYYSEKISLESMGECVGITASHLSSLFTKETGENFIKYLTRVRMEKAKILLKESNDKIYEISEKVGYMNVEHFSRIFRKNIGMSPKQYKNNSQQIL